MHLSTLSCFVAVVTTTAGVQFGDAKDPINIVGIGRNDIEIFLGIPYAQDTSGENRFKPQITY